MKKISKQELEKYSKKLGLEIEELEKIIYTDQQLRRIQSSLEQYQDEIKMLLELGTSSRGIQKFLHQKKKIKVSKISILNFIKEFNLHGTSQKTKSND